MYWHQRGMLLQFMMWYSRLRRNVLGWSSSTSTCRGRNGQQNWITCSMRSIASRSSHSIDFDIDPCSCPVTLRKVFENGGQHWSVLAGKCADKVDWYSVTQDQDPIKVWSRCHCLHVWLCHSMWSRSADPSGKSPKKWQTSCLGHQGMAPKSARMRLHCTCTVPLDLACYACPTLRIRRHHIMGNLASTATVINTHLRQTVVDTRHTKRQKAGLRVG